MASRTSCLPPGGLSGAGALRDFIGNQDLGVLALGVSSTGVKPKRCSRIFVDTLFMEATLLVKCHLQSKRCVRWLLCLFLTACAVAGGESEGGREGERERELGTSSIISTHSPSPPKLTVRPYTLHRGCHHAGGMSWGLYRVVPPYPLVADVSI